MFKSATYLEKISEKVFGERITQASISYFCLGKIKSDNHKGYVFKYSTREKYEEYLNSQAMEKVV